MIFLRNSRSPQSVRIAGLALSFALVFSVTALPSIKGVSASSKKLQSSQTPFLGSPFNIPATIQAEDFDNGGDGIAYSDNDTGNARDLYRPSDVDIENCDEGGFQICCAYAGEWVEYSINVATAGTYNFEARVATNGPGGTIHVEFDGENKTGPIQIPNTGGWQTFQTITVPGIDLSAGPHVMRVSMDANGDQRPETPAVANFNFFRLTTGQSSPPDEPVANPAVAGSWSQPLTWPLVSIHASLLPNGKVIAWANTNVAGSAQAQVWDPATGAFTLVPNNTTNIFCSGHSFLPDGRLLVTGGERLVNNDGEIHSNIFDFRTNSWSRGPDMNAGRWYPSNTTLANGEVLVISGTIDRFVGVNPLPQVFRSNGEWRNLTGAETRSIQLYPWTVLAPDGRVFNAGPDRFTSYLDTTGTGSWSSGPTSNFGYRDYGSVVMYDEGRLMIVGGGTPTNTAEVIDLRSSAGWRSVTSMAHARRHLNATVLPDGKVLVTGGTSGGGFNNAFGAVLAAEMWDPSTERWTLMASMRVRRIYHSIALLLPDGRVLAAGGGIPSAPEGDFDHLDAEIYSPPYLFRGERPVITNAPSNIDYGDSFLVKTPDRREIESVSLVRLSSVTHAFNMEQRFTRLDFLVKKKGVMVSAPANRNVCPPGYYMLFILNGEGVPSVARIVRLGS